MGLQVFWFIAIAVLWTGFFVLEGFDFGVGMLRGVIGEERGGAARRHRNDRPRMGRQRGLADRGRRRDLRSLPVLVRDDVLGSLPRHGACCWSR